MVNVKKIEYGLAKWLDRELMPQLPQEGWRKVVTGAALSLMLKKSENLVGGMLENPFFKLLEIVDDKGDVDIDTVRTEIIKNVPDKGFIIDLPLIGSMTIKKNDIDNLYRYIMED